MDEVQSSGNGEWGMGNGELVRNFRYTSRYTRIAILLISFLSGDNDKKQLRDSNLSHFFWSQMGMYHLAITEPYNAFG